MSPCRVNLQAAHSLSQAFNVFVGTAMLTELISFAFPAALLMWRRRDPKYLPKRSPFNLGKFGWLVNAIVIGWAVFALVIFSFPIAQPITPGSMSKSAGNPASYEARELKSLPYQITPPWFWAS